MKLAKPFNYATLCPIPQHEYTTTIRGVTLDCVWDLLPATVARYIATVCFRGNADEKRKEYNLELRNYPTTLVVCLTVDGEQYTTTLRETDLGKFFTFAPDKGFDCTEIANLPSYCGLVFSEMESTVGRLAYYQKQAPRIVFIHLASVGDDAVAKTTLLSALTHAGYTKHVRIEHAINYYEPRHSYVELYAYKPDNESLLFSKGYISSDEWLMFKDEKDGCEVHKIGSTEELKDMVVNIRENREIRYGMIYEGAVYADWSMFFNAEESAESPSYFVVYVDNEEDQDETAERPF